MDPFLVIPGRPVADHEVSARKPVGSNHRRNRHAPLLHATEWMKVMYHKKNRHPFFQNEPDIIGGGQEAELPPKEVARSLGPALAEKRRGMIYTPQALRPPISAGERDTSGDEFESSLKQLDCPSTVNGEVDLCEDGEVSPKDISRPLFRMFADKKDELACSSRMTPDALRLRSPGHRFCDVARAPAMKMPKSLPNLAVEKNHKVAESSKETPKELPTLPAIEAKRSTPEFQISRKPLPSSTSKAAKALPTSPQVTNIVSAMTEITPGAGCPQVDDGPAGKHTALQSHPPSEEERNHSIGLSEGWKIWKSKKTGDDEGKCLESRVTVKPLRRGVKALFARR